MDDELLGLLGKDFGQTVSILSQIDDIWHRNIGSMKQEQELIVKTIKEFRQRYKDDQETIRQLRSTNKALEEKVEMLSKDKEIYANKLHEVENCCDSLKFRLDEVIGDRNAAIDTLGAREAQMREFKTIVEEDKAELKRLRIELRNANEAKTKSDTQLKFEREKWELHLEEQERNALTRMDEQKKEIEQRMREECVAKIRKYDNAQRQMINDFEDALKDAHAEAQELALERDKFAATAQKLSDEARELEDRVRMEVQQCAAEKFYEMSARFGKTRQPTISASSRRPLSFVENPLQKDVRNLHDPTRRVPTDHSGNFLRRRNVEDSEDDAENLFTKARQQQRVAQKQMTAAERRGPLCDVAVTSARRAAPTISSQFPRATRTARK